MSKTVCKCGAEYEDDIPFGDEQVDSCPRCSKYARDSSTTTYSESTREALKAWMRRKPTAH